MDAREASQLFGSAAHLLAAPQLIGTQLEKLADRNKDAFSYSGRESMLALHEKGQIDPELWPNVFENNFRLLGSPLGREYLTSRRGPISRRLEVLVDEHVNREDTA